VPVSFPSFGILTRVGAAEFRRDELDLSAALHIASIVAAFEPSLIGVPGREPMRCQQHRAGRSMSLLSTNDPL
jgi:hypothetical protein